MSEIIGIQGVKKLVASHIERGFPPYLDLYRPAHGLDEDSLPDLVKVYPNEREALDRWPIASVGAIGLSSEKRSEYIEGGGISYRSIYSMRVYVWCRSTDWDPTVNMRDHMTTAMRSFLLDYQVLNAEQTAYIDEDTIGESYSDVAKVKGDRFVAGAFIAFSAQVDEVIRRPPSGTVATVLADYDLLPHPAME